MTDNETLLEAVKVSRTVDVEGKPKQIIADFSYLFRKGGIYTIIGPSGAGKSTLLRLLNRLDEPTGGKILFHGKNITEYAPCRLRRRIGYLFQTPYLFPRTVRDNFLFVDNSLTEGRITQLLSQVHIPISFLEQDVEKLSIGEKQRVAIARLLATQPEVILLDEPTSALDPSNTEAIERLIKDLVHGDSLTIIMVTHNPEQALRMGGETLLMVGGRLQEAGACEEVINHPRSEAGKRYKAKELQ